MDSEMELGSGRGSQVLPEKTIVQPTQGDDPTVPPSENQSAVDGEMPGAGDSVVDGCRPGWAKFAEIVEEDDDLANLPDLPIVEQDGRKALFIAGEAHQRMLQPFEWTAIATLLGRNPRFNMDYESIFASLRKQWFGSDIRQVRFTAVGEGTFLVRVSSEDDLQKVLVPGAWWIGSQVLVANRWKPGQPYKMEPSSRVQLWMRLPELPPGLRNGKVFSGIAKMLGARFIMADAFTRGFDCKGFARILIDVPLDFDPLPSVELMYQSGVRVEQAIEYEGTILFCRACGATSHENGACRKEEEEEDSSYR